MGIILNGSKPSKIIYNGAESTLYFNGSKIWPEVAPDPYNPLSLPPYTIRVKYKDNSTEPTDKIVRSDCVLNQVSQIPNVWDVTVNDGTYTPKESWEKLFYTHYDLIEVVGANTKGVTSMISTFAGCSSLSSLNLFDTRDVICTDSMFAGVNGIYCESLTSIPEFSFDNASGLYYTFNNTNLTGVKLKNTNNVTYCYGAFRGCWHLKNVDINTDSLQDARYMFYDCRGLSAIPDIGFTAVTKCADMFENCYNVESGISALYGQLSSRITSTANYRRCFRSCGTNTVQGAAELATIPTNWK